MKFVQPNRQRPLEERLGQCVLALGLIPMIVTAVFLLSASPPFPQGAGPNHPDVALSLYFRGLEAARQDSYDIAVKMLTKAIREHPDFPEAYVARGCVRLWFKNEHQLAVDDHTKAISLRPGWAYAYFHRADTYCDDGQYHKALPDCNMGIRLDPDFAAGYALRAGVHKELEQQKQAHEDEVRAEQLGFSGDTVWPIPCPWDVMSRQLGCDIHAFAIKKVHFTVRQPAGFAMLQDRDALERMFRPPDNQLHIAFVTDVDAARIMNGDALIFDRYVAIQSNHKLDATAVTPRMFQEVKSSIRKQGLADVIARNMRTFNEFMSETGQHVDEMKVIGFTETDDSYTLTFLVKQRGQHARVNTVTMRNLRGYCIVIATTAVCRHQDDIEWSKSAAAECAESLK